MSIFKKKLSKRAQKLLDEINAQDMSPQDKDNKNLNNVNENRLAVRYVGSKQKFSAIKYRKFAAQNKMIVWSLSYLVLGAIIFFVANNGWGSYQTYSAKVMKSKQKLPKVIAEIKSIEKNAQKIQQDILNKKQNIQDQLNKIPSQSGADDLVNQVAMLLKMGFKIVKQEIQIKKSLSPVTFSIPPLQNQLQIRLSFQILLCQWKMMLQKLKKIKKYS